VSASARCGLRTSAGSSIVYMCNPCPRTLLLPISPTVQRLASSARWRVIHALNSARRWRQAQDAFDAQEQTGAPAIAATPLVDQRFAHAAERAQCLFGVGRDGGGRRGSRCVDE